MLPLHPSRTSYPPHHNHSSHHLSPPSSILPLNPSPLAPPLHLLLFTLHPAQAHKNNPEKLVDLHYVPAMATLQSQGRLGWI